MPVTSAPTSISELMLCNDVQVVGVSHPTAFNGMHVPTQCAIGLVHNGAALTGFEKLTTQGSGWPLQIQRISTHVENAGHFPMAERISQEPI